MQIPRADTTYSWGGYAAGRNNTTGSHNTFIGIGAGYSNTIGSENIYLGKCAGKYGSTYDFGKGDIQPPSYNIFIGSYAGCRSAQGCHSILIGNCAGCCHLGPNNNNNILIGRASGVGSYGLANLTTECNRIILGNSAHTCAQIQIGWTTVSDIRDKCIFGPVPHGRSFLSNINPIAYAFKNRETGEITDPAGKKRYGFSAQEISDLEGDESVIVSKENPDKYYLTSDYLVPVLVNAVKELSSELESVKARLDALENK